MNKNSETKNREISIILSSILLVCTLLLGACNGASSGPKAVAASSPTATAVPLPTVSPALQTQGTAQLQDFQHWISLLQQYGGDASSYQQQYTSDEQALNTATSDSTYSAALQTLKQHLAAIQFPTLKVEAPALRQKLIAEAKAWGTTHTYHDSYNGVTYQMAYEYGANGIASNALYLLNTARTQADYQYLVDQENIWLANFQAYQTNVDDKTPYNQVHQTDTQLIQQYGYASGKVIVVSLSEQAMRVYQDGQLVKSFLVVTGMPAHPSLPGTWWVQSQQRNVPFNSGVKPGQEGYYPPLIIGYAMQYHSNGYFLHQSWWRHKYGPYLQFPHLDPGGTSGAQIGTHGCVNMSTPDVQWLFSFAQVNSTKIIIY